MNFWEKFILWFYGVWGKKGSKISFLSSVTNRCTQFFLFLDELKAAENVKTDLIYIVWEKNDFCGENLVLRFLSQKGPNWAQN